jgi:hypothetical protein
MHTHTHTHTCTCTYINTHTHIHTHADMHMHTRTPRHISPASKIFYSFFFNAPIYNTYLFALVYPYIPPFYLFSSFAHHSNFIIYFSENIFCTGRMSIPIMRLTIKHSILQERKRIQSCINMTVPL